MQHDEMLSLFLEHRKAEAARDFDAIMATFVDDCYLEMVPLNLRIEGRSAARAAYEGYFTTFPDLTPSDEGFAFGDDVVVTWGTLRGTSTGDWLGVPPSGRAFALQFVNVARFRADGWRARASTLISLPSASRADYPSRRSGPPHTFGRRRCGVVGTADKMAVDFTSTGPLARIRSPLPVNVRVSWARETQ